MSWRRLILGALLALAAGCGGAAVTDPLAPVPTSVDPDEIAIPALRVAWSHTSEDEEEQPEIPVQGPAVGDSAVFVPYPGRIDAFDLEGERSWTTQLGSELVLAPIAFRGGIAVATVGGWYWIDGSGAITTRHTELSDVTDAVARGDGIIVVAPDRVARLVLTTEADLALDWSTAVPGALRVAVGRPDAAASDIYVTTTDAVLALAPATGSLRWRSADVTPAPLRVAVDRGVYVVAADGRLHAIDPDNGSARWGAKEIGVRVEGSPVALEGLVWVPGLDGAIHGFTTSGGSHLFRIRVNGRVRLDLATWGSWVLASPQYGPWVLVHGPRRSTGPADPGTPRRVNIGSSDDIALPPGVGPAGVAVVDTAGTVRLLTPERGLEPEDEQR